jgi:cobyrinic acid a,c-diamide synthase
VRGFTEFRVQGSESGVKSKNPEPSIAGVIFNRVASESHYNRLKESVRDVPVLGYLPRDIDFEIPHRHLGLTTAEENPLALENIEKLADTVLTYIDIEGLIKSAECQVLCPPFQGEGEGLRPTFASVHASAGCGDGFHDNKGNSNISTHPHPSPLPEGEGGRVQIIRIAVAYDKAFSFYYEDNLDLMRDAGAEIVRFSPLADQAIPDADAVYIGGGYPEIHADALSRNSSMLRSIRAWADSGKPMYAECGGLMYLSKGIRDFDNKLISMAGVFPFETRMMRKPRLGYREIVLKSDCILGSKGERYRGHEFHYSEIVEDRGQGSGGWDQGKVYSVTNASGDLLSDEGFKYINTLSSYVHIHFGSNARRSELFADFVRRN